MTGARLSRAEFVAECEWLAESGVGAREAARRLSCADDAFEARLRRASCGALLARLRANDPAPVQVLASTHRASAREVRFRRWAHSPEGRAVLAAAHAAQACLPVEAETITAHRRMAAA